MGLFSRLVEVVDTFFFDGEPLNAAYEQRKWKRQEQKLKRMVSKGAQVKCL